MNSDFEVLINLYLDGVIEQAHADESGDAILAVVERIGREEAKEFANQLSDILSHAINEHGHRGDLIVGRQRRRG